MNKVAVVTGGSSGIGQCTAKALCGRGYKVYEISRRDSVQNGITHISADVTDEAAVDRAVAEIMSREHRIDVLINNAGFGISGAIEFTETDAAKKLFDVNFFGMVNMNRAVISHMRKAGSGRIINISSVAAIAPIPFQAYYSAVKSAVSTYTMALANELRPFGITVCAVMPGDIKTGFTAARKKISTGDDIYGGRIERSVRTMEKDEQNGMSPEKAGAYICRIADRKKVKPVYTIGFMYKCAAFLIKILPCGIMNRIVGRMYAA